MLLLTLLSIAMVVVFRVGHPYLEQHLGRQFLYLHTYMHTYIYIYASSHPVNDLCFFSPFSPIKLMSLCRVRHEDLEQHLGGQVRGHLRGHRHHHEQGPVGLHGACVCIYMYIYVCVFMKDIYVCIYVYIIYTTMKRMQWDAMVRIYLSTLHAHTIYILIYQPSIHT
jgi:hypothetical protein